MLKVQFWYVLNEIPWNKFRAFVEKYPIDPLLADASGFCRRTASLRDLYSGAREKNPEIFQQLEQEWRAQRSRWRHYVKKRPWILAVIDHSDVLTPPEPSAAP